MELKEFIAQAINDIVGAVKSSDEASDREVSLVGSDHSRTVEFDIAVSAEERSEGKIGGGIKVWGLVSGEVGTASEITSSTVSRLRFGVNVDACTKQERNRQKAKTDAYYQELSQRSEDWRLN